MERRLCLTLKGRWSHGEPPGDSRRGPDPHESTGAGDRPDARDRGAPRGGCHGQHRLVTVGDSLTHGFMSAAVHRTDLSWPAIAAYELGLTAEQFTFPTYEWPTGPGGLPLDLERLARAFEKRFGAHLDFWEIVTAGLWLQSYMDRIEDYWERGEGSRTPPGGAPFHNMAVYGWDLLDPQLLTSTMVASRLARPTKDDPLSQLVEHHQDRAAWPVLQRARKGNRGRTVLDAVTDMSGPAPGRRDAGGRPGLQQRTRRGGHAGARVDTRGVRRPPARAASGGPRRLQPVAPQRVRRRLVPARGEAARGRRPAHHHRDGPVGHHRADRPRHLQEDPAAVPVLPLLHEALDHRRGLRHQARSVHHRRRGPGDRLRHRLLQRDDDRLRRRRPPRWPRLVPVRHGLDPRSARDPPLHRQSRGRGRPGGPPTSCRARCARWTRCRTPGSSGRGRTGAPTAACSPSTACTRRRAPTASSPRRSSR